MQVPIAPPFPNKSAFFCRFMTEMGWYLDEDGRRLHEVDFRDEQEDGGYARCPFRDSRHGFLMNRSALKQIGANWDEVVEGVRYFSTLFPIEEWSGPSLSRAWRISLMTMFAPLYLLKRRDRPFSNGSLPATVAGVFKIMLDVSTTIDLMLITQDSNGFEPHARATGDAIRRYAEESLILLNGEYACAGPDTLIKQVLDLLFAAGERLGPNESTFSSFFPNALELRQFCYLMSCQYVIGLIYQLTTMTIMEAAFTLLVERGLFDSPRPKEERPSAYERRRRIALSTMTNPKLQQGVLDRFSEWVRSAECWGLAPSADFRISEFTETCKDTLLSMSGKSPAQLLSLHRDFQNIAHGTIEVCQQKIAGSTGGREFFPANPLITEEPSPDVILGHMLLRQELS